MTAPLTGSSAEAGVALRQGAEMAVEEINDQGGIEFGHGKHKVVLYVEDNECKPEVGVSAAERLITKEHVHYLIGDAILSSVTMAIMELAPRYQIPIVSAESVSEAIAEKVSADPMKYGYFWKMNFGSTAYAQAIFGTVKWLVETNQFKPRTRKAFFIIEDTDYGRSNAKVASDLLTSIGWSTVAIETVPPGATEFYAQLGKLRAAQADLLVSIFTPLSSGVALVKQFHELGISSLHLAIYYPARPEFIQQVGSLSEGLLWCPLLFDPEHLDVQQAFAARIRKRFGADATLDHAYAYDAIYNAADCIGRAASLEPASIVASLRTLDRNGLLGRYNFDEANHQVRVGEDLIAIPVAQIQDQHNRIIWPEKLAASAYRPQPWTR